VNTRAFKYFITLLVYVLAWLACTQNGWLTWSPILYAWVLLHAVELLSPPCAMNSTDAEQKLANKHRLYDFLLSLFVPVQFMAWYQFLFALQNDPLPVWETAGRIASMGLLCGSFGINVAHELGHRVNRYEQFLAKALLLTSLYMHFYIEHNKGHHKKVATPEDPSSARYNEPVYAFYFRTVIFSYISAWKIAGSEVRKKGHPLLHWKNEMLQMQVIQLLFIGLIAWQFGWLICLYFLIAATMGFLLLETVNYIEHYGLQRQQTG